MMKTVDEAIREKVYNVIKLLEDGLDGRVTEISTADLELASAFS